MLKEKLALIYEYNKNSPLFVRAADDQISKNNLLVALDILTNGLKNYPEYPTAYIILGKLLVLQGNYQQAEKAFTKGTDLLNCKSSLNYYISSMESTRSIEYHFPESKRVSFTSDELSKLLVEKDYEPDLYILSKENDIKNDELKSGNFEDRLDDLAKEINAAKIVIDESKSLPERTEEKKFDDQEMVTETLAKIYISQGNINEALNIYEKLKIKFPDKTTVFQKKIDELKIGKL